jgi:peptidoglycan hydrolase-like protein with peptidoglycan-binding domain
MKKYLVILVAILVIPAFVFADTEKKNNGNNGNGNGGASREIKNEAKEIHKQCKAFLKTLRRGHKDRNGDDDISALQAVLSEQGFLVGTPTGFFGSMTQAAIEAFQAKNGLERTGAAGPLTRALIGKFHCAGVGQIVKNLIDDRNHDATKPDLKITAVACTPNPLGFGVGANCNVTIYNNSIIAASSTFMVNGGNASTSVTALGAKETKVIALTNVFSTSTAGKYKVTFKVDSSNVVVEGNENNNTFVKELIVGTPSVCPNLTTIIPGDANCNGTIDSGDYVLINAGFRNQNPINWANGDFNQDGKIDFDDFALIDRSFNTQAQKTVTVVSPNGNETWSVGSLHTITWTTTNFPSGSQVTINLIPTTGAVIALTTNTANDGTEQITVPNTVSVTAGSNQYRVQVVNTTFNVADLGDGTITMSQMQQPVN